MQMYVLLLSESIHMHILLQILLLDIDDAMFNVICRVTPRGLVTGYQLGIGSGRPIGHGME